jgi:hypothetical protein
MNRMQEHSEKNVHKIIPVTACLLILIPLLIVKPQNGKCPGTGLPGVFNGDEPHYLLMINSIIKDGDLDLKNNYDSVYAGADQAGKKFAGVAINHQTFWYIDKKYTVWPDIYACDNSLWKKHTPKAPAPLPRPGKSPPPENLPEYGIHPPGMAIILAPFLYPLKNSGHIEHGALFLCAIALIIAFFFFRMLLSGFTESKTAIDAVSFISFFCTPVWHYGRVLCVEPFLVLCITAAFAFFLVKKKYALSGSFMAAGFFIKSPFIMIAMPFAIYLAVNKKFRALIVFSTPLFIALAATAFIDVYMCNGIFRPLQPFVAGNVFSGASGLLFSPSYGIFLFSPFIMASVSVLPVFTRKHGMESFIIFTGAASYFLVISLWHCWWGGDSFGPRLLVPVIPLMTIPLVYIKETVLFKCWTLRYAFIAAVCVSLFINAAGAILHWQYNNRNPAIAAIRKICTVSVCSESIHSAYICVKKSSDSFFHSRYH